MIRYTVINCQSRSSMGMTPNRRNANVLCGTYQALSPNAISSKVIATGILTARLKMATFLILLKLLHDRYKIGTRKMRTRDCRYDICISKIKTKKKTISGDNIITIKSIFFICYCTCTKSREACSAPKYLLSNFMRVIIAEKSAQGRCNCIKNTICYDTYCGDKGRQSGIAANDMCQFPNQVC